MTLTIKMELDNAAFEDGGPNEVARILIELGMRLPEPLEPTTRPLSLHDINGNKVGEAEIK